MQIVFSSMFAEYLLKFDFLIFQGSVATSLTWGGYCRMGFVANFICFPAAQKIWKSDKIRQSYREFKGGNFLRHSVYCIVIIELKTARYQHWLG